VELTFAIGHNPWRFESAEDWVAVLEPNNGPPLKARERLTGEGRWDACRAVDFAQSRPEVDNSRIGVHGSSQGGALTITTAALRSDAIACGAAGAPYLCGYMESATLTHSYPYEEINEYLRLYPEHEQEMWDTLAYFDGINFAPKIKCPMLTYIGLEDDVCPPETGFAVHNAMNCPKELHTHANCAHDAGIYWEMPRVEAFLAEHLKPAAPKHKAELTQG
jgi:cephalosporin-C deacetylase